MAAMLCFHTSLHTTQHHRKFPEEVSAINGIHYRVGHPFTGVRMPLISSIQVHNTLGADGHSTFECEPRVQLEEKAMTCHLCGRRHMLSSMGAILSFETNLGAHASIEPLDSKRVVETVRPKHPDWYEEFFAYQMDVGMKSYETQMAGYKAQLFEKLERKAQTILELGIGTGPNIKYYADRPDISIIGVDPNSHMEKYATAAAYVAGIQPSNFKFLQGVGEALPVKASSVDAVVCTLVLCSVKDVEATLKEIKRVLKPGGSFLFIEHVAAPEGSIIRLLQNVLDPIQQFLADGCHLTRNTLKSIEQVDFSAVNVKSIDVSRLGLLVPQIIGIAQV